MLVAQCIRKSHPFEDTWSINGIQLKLSRKVMIRVIVMAGNERSTHQWNYVFQQMGLPDHHADAACLVISVDDMDVEMVYQSNREVSMEGED